MTNKIYLVRIIYWNVILKYLLIILNGILLFSCIEHGVNQYLHDNKISINYSIEKSKYIDQNYEKFDLTNEQKLNLNEFLELFNLSTKYYKHIINKNVFEYEIIGINIFSKSNVDNKTIYGFLINFYSLDKLFDYSEYNKEGDFWKTYNIALYQHINNKIEFIGWFFKK